MNDATRARCRAQVRARPVRACCSPHQQSGAALLLVLWLIALLAALVGAFATTARIEHLQGNVASRGVVAEQAARAGIEYAMTRLGEKDERRRWLPDGRDYNWRFGSARLQIEVVDENGKIDLNAAQQPVLAGLFRALGVERTEAERLGAAIVDWRDPDPLSQPAGGGEDQDYAAADLPYGAKDAPFDTVAELLQVLGMTPQLFARAAPNLTVFSGMEAPDPSFAPGPVLQAMGMDSEAVLAQRKRWDPASGIPPPAAADGVTFLGASSGTYSISSQATLADGSKALLRVVVRAGGNGLPGVAYLPLQWEEGTSLR